MLVNKSDYQICIESKDSKQVIVPPHSHRFYYSKLDKAQLSVKSYSKSKEFDISTVGLSGSITIKKQHLIKGDEDNTTLDFGVYIVNADTPF